MLVTVSRRGSPPPAERPARSRSRWSDRHGTSPLSRRANLSARVYRLLTLAANEVGCDMEPRSKSVHRPATAAASRRVHSCAALLLTATVLLSACSGDGGGAIADGTTTTTERRSTATSPTTTAPDATGTTGAPAGAEAEIAARYTSFWDARLAANQAPVNPDHPLLPEYATGQQLDNVMSETRRRRDDGLAIRRPENSVTRHDVQVTAVDGEVATVQDCSVNDGIIYRVATGEVVNDDVVTQSVRATMRLVDAKWKLERATLVQEWQGVAGCALAGD